MGDCGVAGVVVKKGSNSDAYSVLEIMLRALQHRGQLTAGVSVCDTSSSRFEHHKGMGLVHTVLDRQPLTGNVGIGHVRYATSGTGSEGTRLADGQVEAYRERVVSEAQPFHYHDARPQYEFTFAFNGQLVNADEVRKDFQGRDFRFRTDTDTEVLMHVIAEELQREKTGSPGLVNVFSNVVQRLRGAYNIVFVDGLGRFAALRDKYGFHPLAFAHSEDFFVAASETIAFEHLNGVSNGNVGFVEPGEMLLYDKGLARFSIAMPLRTHCVFEMIYFMHVLSRLSHETSVYSVRTEMGKKLAASENLAARSDFRDFVVVAVPETAKAAAEKYARELGLEFHQGGIVRDSYGGRAFIMDPMRRQKHLELKYAVNSGVVRGKNVVVLDDSIVRGDASEKVVKMLRDAGANEVHFRVTFPPIVFPCKYGIDFPDVLKLIVHKVGWDSNIGELERKIAAKIGADSFGYPTIDLLLDVVSSVLGLRTSDLCHACISGDYRET